MGFVYNENHGITQAASGREESEMIDQACTNTATSSVEDYRDHTIFFRLGLGYFAFVNDDRREAEAAVELMSDEEVENDQESFVRDTIQDIRAALDDHVHDMMAARVDPDQ